MVSNEKEVQNPVGKTVSEGHSAGKCYQELKVEIKIAHNSLSKAKNSRRFPGVLKSAEVRRKEVLWGCF